MTLLKLLCNIGVGFFTFILCQGLSFKCFALKNQRTIDKMLDKILEELNKEFNKKMKELEEISKKNES